MTLRAVLFDLDDTLHDKTATLKRVASIQYESGGLAALGVGVDAWLRHYVNLNNQRIEKTAVFSKLAFAFALPFSLETRLLQDFDENLGKLAVPYPGAHELISSCKSSGLKVGVITNGRDAFQRSKIDGMGMRGAIDATFTSGGFGVKKPDQAIFLACLAELSVQPSQAAFVGDDFAADMEPAIELGMPPIWKSGRSSNRVAFSSNDLARIHAHLRSVA